MYCLSPLFLSLPPSLPLSLSLSLPLSPSPSFLSLPPSLSLSPSLPPSLSLSLPLSLSPSLPPSLSLSLPLSTSPSFLSLPLSFSPSFYLSLFPLPPSLSSQNVSEYSKINMSRTVTDDGSTQEEYDFNSEITLDQQVSPPTFCLIIIYYLKQQYVWQGKYRPRKPRFFNRVHTVR